MKFLWLGLLLLFTFDVAAKQARVALILMGQTHEYWHALRAGANDVAKRQELQLLNMDPLYENQSDSQEGLVYRAVEMGVDGIVIAPSDSLMLQESLKYAMEKDVQVVLVDSGLSINSDIPVIATDNFAAGQEMAKLIKSENVAGGKVVILGLPTKVASTLARVEGLVSELKGHATIARHHLDLLSIGEAFRVLEQIESDLLTADVVFACNESSTKAMLSWYDSRPNVTPKLYGFDMAPTILAALKSRELNAVAVQDPYTMGEKAVTHLHSMLHPHPHGQELKLEGMSPPFYLVTPKLLESQSYDKRLSRYLKTTH
ncbi:substrate-binding domain-containing protein [Corallincola platygyrae]|uniref:Substrate-binding domain-containing protein n=1 Tax=Corallincola platygyrae TaxID=1193278 RepID=A0ABW4XJZ9_9GAMM